MNSELTLTLNLHLEAETALSVKGYDGRPGGHAFVALELGEQSGPNNVAVLVHDLDALANLADAVDAARVELARVLGESKAHDSRQAVLPSAV